MISAEAWMAWLVRLRPVGGLVHRDHSRLRLFARTVRDVHEELGGIGHTLDGSDHLVDGCGGLGNARSLHLRVLHHVLHVDAHLVHRARDFVDGGGGLHADLGGFVGGRGHLSRAAGHLRSAVADLADEIAEAMRHAREGFRHRVLLRPGLDGDGKFALGDGCRNGSHLFQVNDHLVEILGQHSDFVRAMDVDRLIEIAGITDLAGNFNQVIERLFDRFCRIEGYADSQRQGEERAEGRHDPVPRIGGTGRRVGFVVGFLHRAFGFIEYPCGLIDPGCRIVLQVADLQIGDGRVSAIDLMPFGDQVFREALRPLVFVVFHL